MTVKKTNSKASLALLIEKKLGYPMVKKAKFNHASHHSDYSTQGKRVVEYSIQSNHSTIKRALKRQQLQKIQRQTNLESIMAGALSLCPDIVSKARPDPDWLEHFIALAEDIANQAMQTLWAKILVGETLSPGTFSIKSLQTLKQMTQKEANALQRCAPLCGFVEHEGSYLIIIGYYKKPSFFDLLRKGNKESINLAQSGLSYPNILTLMDIGLVYRKEIESLSLIKNQSFQLSFQSTKLTLIAKSNELVLSYYKLTQTGEELKRLITAPVNKHNKKLLEQALMSEFTCEWSDNKVKK